MYDSPVTAMTMMALWFKVWIRFSMQDMQQATKQRQTPTIGFPSLNWSLDSYLTKFLRIVKTVMSKAPKVIEPMWYLFIVQAPLQKEFPVSP